MANTQKLKKLIADWESNSDDIPFGLDEDDRVILEAMKFAAANHDIAARLEAAEELNNHLELAVRKAEGVSEALRKRAEDAENKLLFTRAAPPASFVVKLPKRYSIDAFDRLESDDDGFLFYSDAVVEAIKAAGGSVENDK